MSNQKTHDAKASELSELLVLLKAHEGEIVEFFYRGKYRRFELMAVQTDDNFIIKGTTKYKGNIGDVRLDYAYPGKREWWGFWTNKIDRIKLIKQN